MSDRSVVCSPTNWCHHRYPCSTGCAQPAAPGRLSPALARHHERYCLRYYGESSNGSVEVLLSGCGNDVHDAREQARGLCVNRVGVRIVMKATRTIGGNRGHEVEVRDNVELLAGAVVSGDVVEVKDVISDDCCLQTVAGVGGLCGRVTAGAESQRGEEDERKPGPRHEKLRVRCGHQGCVDEACTPKRAAGGQGPIKCRLPLVTARLARFCHRFLRGSTRFRLQSISPRY